MRCFFKHQSVFKSKVMEQSNLLPLGKPVLNQPALFIGKGKIEFGQNVNIGYFPSPYFYSTYAHIEVREKSAKIVIGNETFISNNACIIANRTTISIGSKCRIGANFCCFDSDFHGLSVQNRDNPEFVISKSVFIGNNVFIGQNVTILKGCRIGNNVVVGNGAVVTKSFPDNVIIAGNPAKVIREINDE